MPSCDHANFCRGRRRFYAATAVAGVGCFLFLLSYFAYGERTDRHRSLRLVSVIFRHGDRTPTENYPNDPYGASHWPQGWGSLTKLGMQQMHQLGILFRNRYDGFVSGAYSSEEALLVSSDHDRCLMSAQVFLAGLYPPEGEQLWNPRIPWQPIPVHTTPKHLDGLIVMRKPCPAYDRELKATYSSPYVSKINEDNAELYQYLGEHSGSEVKDVLAVEKLYNTLEIEEKHGLKLPAWTDAVYPEKMRDLAALSLSLFTFSDKQKRLKGGPLLRDIADHMSRKALEKAVPDRKLFLYSGHDLNLVSTFRVLGFTDLIKPDNAAALVFELHAGDEIRLFYFKNSETTTPEEVKIPGCSDPCTLPGFLEKVEPFLPTDWEKECVS